MITGNIKRIDLGQSSFENLINDNNLYIDKSRFIENFLNESNSVQLVVRQRRLGKSLNIDMLRVFLTDLQDTRHLFKDLYIESSSVWNEINTSPVFLFDFKNLNAKTYTDQISNQIIKHILCYVDVDKLPKQYIKPYNELLNNPAYTEGLLLLTELVHEATGKRSYILIDEYDKLLTDNYNSDDYEAIKAYETALLSTGLKGNKFLKKALLTGVMRISRESILSGLNNLYTYDIFSDYLYQDDFGLTEHEINELYLLGYFDRETVKSWYNGIKINGKSIYNIYSVLSFIKSGHIGNYWGRSGTLDIIRSLLTNDRLTVLEKLLSGQTIEAEVDRRISLNDLSTDTSDATYYSVLVQAGYLALEHINHENDNVRLSIPNTELMNVWKEFILQRLTKGEVPVKTLFNNIENLELFDNDLQYFLSDKLSYYDIDNSTHKTRERIYHVFVLGLLSAYEDITYIKPPLSNRESGDGRYYILLERKGFCIIFEFKSVDHADQLPNAVQDGLRQIEDKRYYADVPKGTKLIKTSIAFCGKQCITKSVLHVWDK